VHDAFMRIQCRPTASSRWWHVPSTCLAYLFTDSSITRPHSQFSNKLTSLSTLRIYKCTVLLDTEHPATCSHGTQAAWQLLEGRLCLRLAVSAGSRCQLDALRSQPRSLPLQLGRLPTSQDTPDRYPRLLEQVGTFSQGLCVSNATAYHWSHGGTQGCVSYHACLLPWPCRFQEDSGKQQCLTRNW
jgi:hypothetical protein